MKIVIDDAIPFIRGVFESVANVVYISGGCITRDVVMDADALIIRTRTKCDRNLLHETNVKVICSATIGYDHIDTHFCAISGIKWFTAPGCNANSVAQYFLSSLAVITKEKSLLFSNLTIGIVGFGNVGKLIFNYCKLLGIRVLVNDPPLQCQSDVTFQFTSLHELIRESDIITFHIPLVKMGNFPTFHLLNMELLRFLKRDVVLINTSRGEVVNEYDLEKYIQSNFNGQLIMDVWENEPRINEFLLEKCLISTSHIAGYSADGKFNATIGCVGKICNEFKLPNLLNLVSNPLPPSNSHIIVNCKDRNFENIFFDVILQTYNVNDDSILLKLNLLNFEAIRNSYPNRREFSAYSLTLENSTPFLNSVFANFGFKNLTIND